MTKNLAGKFRRISRLGVTDVTARIFCHAADNNRRCFTVHILKFFCSKFADGPSSITKCHSLMKYTYVSRLEITQVKQNYMCLDLEVVSVAL